MPLLRRQPFAKQKPPPDLTPEDEVFLCKLTGEIFTDYEKFFERIILCNSLVWTCELTGHPGLTYQEALESEEKARKQLSSLPTPLQRPILYLATLTHRSRLNDMNDDIYSFVRDRFFVGEAVDVLQGGDRKLCKVIKVISQDNRTATEDGADSSSSDDVVCLDDPPKPKSPSTKSPAKKESLQAPDPTEFEYVVQETRKPNIYVVKPGQISRKKGLYTRDKSKLYLKQHCDPEGDGVWKVKSKYRKRFKLSEVSFDDFFDGPKPKFEVSKVKRKPASRSTTAVIDLTAEDEALKRAKLERKEQRKRKKKEDKEKLREEKKLQKAAAKQQLMNLEAEKTMSPEQRMALKEKMKEERLAAKMAKKEELKKKSEEEKLKRKEERDKEREKKKEEKKMREEYLKEWSKPREDMDCDDFKNLPIPTPIRSHVPQELFGDAVMLLEYLRCFESLLDTKSQLPNGISLAELGKALLETDVKGLYTELVLLMLSSIFQLQEEEEAEETEMEKQQQGTQATVKEISRIHGASYKMLVKSATVAQLLPQRNFCTSLRKLQLDSFTMSEILRQHFLASGAELSASNARWNYQQRGAFTSFDDPGLELKMQEPGIIKALAGQNICDLSPGDKLKVLIALSHQLLSYVASRDLIEDNSERLKVHTGELRTLRNAEQRREKDEAAFWWHKRMDERAKEREIEAEKKAQKKKEKEDQLRKEEGGEAEKMEVDETEGNNKSEKMNLEPERRSARQKALEELKESNYDVMDLPTENIDWEKIAPEERLRMKERYQRKEKDLSSLIDILQHGTAVYPLGRDRTFRRYWVFRSIPGLFVEDEEEDFLPDDCLQPVEQTASSNPFLSDNLPLKDKKPTGEEKSTSSDKENESFENNQDKNALPPTDEESPNSIMLNKQNIKPLKGLSENIKEVGEHDVIMDIEEKQAVPCISVHEQIKLRSSIPWAYYSDPQQLDVLIASLNPRGYREGPLKQALQEHRTKLEKGMKTCPVNMLSIPQQELESLQEKNVCYQELKSRNRKTQGAVNNASAKEFLELNLRESLLDMEERVHFGTLGALQVKKREIWRDALESGNYDPQSDEVPWANEQRSPVKKPKSATESEGTEGESDSDSDNQCLVVRDLARALLQIMQGIDQKYLGPPLGETQNAKKAAQRGGRSNRAKDKQGDSSSDSDSDNELFPPVKKTPLERWSESLLGSCNFSQVFVHMSVLETSIIWSKSALHARCRICRRKSDGEHMLLCDGCDRGHHMYCLKPPVKKVPKGEWFCPDCRPKDVVRTPRKRRKSIFEEDSEDAEGEGSSEDEEDESQRDDSEDEEVEEDDSDEEDSDDDSDDDDDSDEDSDEDEEEEEDSPKPAKIKFLKASAKKQKPSSGRSTPTEAPKRNSKGRSSLTTAQDKSSSGKNRSSLEKPGSRAPSRNSMEKGEGAAGRSTSRHSLEPERPSSRSAKRSLDVGEPSAGKVSRQSLENTKVVTTRPRRSGEPAAGGKAAQSKRKREEEEEDSQPELKKSAATTKKRSSEKVQALKDAEEMVLDIAQRDEAWPFLKPVTRRDAPDYQDIIKRPMDFSTVRNKINKFEYVDLGTLLEDVRTIFRNCHQYNMPTAPEYLAGQKLSRFFEKQVKDLHLDVVASKKSPKKQSPSPVKRSRSGKRT